MIECRLLQQTRSAQLSLVRRHCMVLEAASDGVHGISTALRPTTVADLQQYVA